MPRCASAVRRAVEADPRWGDYLAAIEALAPKLAMRNTTPRPTALSPQLMVIAADDSSAAPDIEGTPMVDIARLGSALLMASVVSTASAQSSAGPQAANIRNVVAFYEKALNDKDVDAALQYVGDRYVQHNPTAADGKEGFRKFIGFLKERYPQSHNEVKKAYADGDFVILHVHSIREPGTLGVAIVDIFKLENGKVIEHWDVVQPIPANVANDNGMF